MKIYRPDLLFLFVLSTGGAAHAQDADHLTTNGVGQSFLAPDAGVPGGLGVLPQNVTIGTAPAFGATLRVRGDQLNVADQFDPPSWCTFRSDIHNGGRQNWSMVRQDNILGDVEVGRLYHGSDFNWFAVQAPQPNGDNPGILWLENAEKDGMMIRANGDQDDVNGYPLRLEGFASIGYRGLISPPGMQNVPSRARLHLIDEHGDVEEPWRPYYRNGVLFSGNGDMGYVGHRYYDEDHEAPWTYTRDHSDLLISAGEDDMEDPLRQRIRFTYTTRPDPAATIGAATYNGLEFMQLWPDRATSGFVGIGDFTAAAADPDERLHVLDRTIRIQRIVPDYHDDDLDKVVVTDNDGRLHWRDATTLNLADCEWRMYPSPGPNHVYTATGAPDADCPDDLEFVGIGTATPQFKLDVKHTRSTSGSVGGIRSTYLGSATGSNTGVHSIVDAEDGTSIDFGNAVIGEVDKLSDSGTGVTGSVNLNTGGGNANSQVAGAYGTVNAADGYYGFVYGTRGLVNTSGTTIDRAYGAYGRVAGSSSMSAAYGLWGESQAESTVGSNYGGQAVSTWLEGASVSQSIGLRARSERASGVTATQATNSYGLIAQGRSGSTGTWGVNATASTTGSGATTWGVYASGANAGTNYGLYATASGPGGSTNYAGYFQGDMHVNGVASCPAMLWTSDASLKTDVDDISGASELLAQVRPRSYRFRTEEFPNMNLPSGAQLGLIAQELETVLPDLVSPVTIAATWDTLGQEITPSSTIRAVNYIELIPLLIAAFQEQQTVIAQLQSDLSGCCTRNTERSINNSAESQLRETDLRIVPNPVADLTELRYTVGSSGRIRLEITDATGRSIQVRDEGVRATGSYAYEWNTTLLAPGTYYCTLFVNDEPLVKKAVKLNAH